MNNMWLVVLGGVISFIGSILTTFLVNELNNKREKREQKRKIITEAIKFFKELESELRKHYLKLESLQSQFINDQKENYNLSELIPIIELVKNEVYSSRFYGPKYYLNVFSVFNINDIGELIIKIQFIHSLLAGNIQGEYLSIIHNWQTEFLDYHKIDIRNENQEIPNGVVFGQIFQLSRFERLITEINNVNNIIQELNDDLYKILLKI